MEEKKLSKRYPSLRTFSGFRSFHKHIFRRLNLSKYLDFSRSIRLSKGFTLIELLVVVGMVAVLISFLLLFINPFKQIQKARDAQRQNNLKQVTNALDTYYNDNSRYPNTVPFGASWQVGSTVYMNEVPEDPDCSNAGSCYAYMTDSSNPQWNVLFSRLSSTQNSSTTCALTGVSSCVPSNFDASGYNFCIVSGQVDCNYISQQTLPSNPGGGSGGSNPTSTHTPTPIYTSTPTPTAPPTPTPTPCATFYANTGFGGACNNLGSDSGNQCIIHGGSFVCYSISSCSPPVCQ